MINGSEPCDFCNGTNGTGGNGTGGNDTDPCATEALACYDDSACYDLVEGAQSIYAFLTADCWANSACAAVMECKVGQEPQTGENCTNEIYACIGDAACSPLMEDAGPGPCLNNSNCTAVWKCMMQAEGHPCQ